MTHPISSCRNAAEVSSALRKRESREHLRDVARMQHSGIREVHRNSEKLRIPAQAFIRAIRSLAAFPGRFRQHPGGLFQHLHVVRFALRLQQRAALGGEALVFRFGMRDGLLVRAATSVR